MSASLLAWAKATLNHSHPAAAAAVTRPAFHCSGCYAAASAIKQHKLLPDQSVWRQAHLGRHSYSSQAAIPSQSGVKSYLGPALVASVAGVGAAAVYLGNKAGQQNGQHIVPPHKQTCGALFADCAKMKMLPPQTSVLFSISSLCDALATS